MKRLVNKAVGKYGQNVRTCLAALVVIVIAGAGSSVMADSYGDMIMGRPGITNYWRFSETSGSSAADSVGSDTGTYDGSVTLGDPGPRPSDGFGGMPSGNVAPLYDPTEATVFNSAADLLNNEIDTITVSLWYKLDPAGSDATRQIIFGYQQNADTRYNFLVARMENGRLRAYAKDSGGAQLAYDLSDAAYLVAATNSDWHNLVFAWDGSLSGDGLLTTYLDGSNVMFFSASGVNGNLSTNCDSLVIGGDINDSSGFDGWIDEVAVFSRVLSEDEVAEQYATKRSVYAQAVYNLEPVHYWRLGETTAGSGKIAHDVISGKNGTYSAVAGNGPRPTDGFLGFSAKNRALSYNGSSDYITFANPDELGSVKKFSTGITNITITTWVRTDNTNSGLHVVGGYQTGSLAAKYAFLCQYDAASQGCTFYAKDSSGSQIIPTPPGIVLNDTVWHFLVWSWDGTTVRMYLDGGENEQTSTGAGSGGLYTPEQLTFGRGEGGLGRYFDGQFDEIAIFDRTLTATEITALYDAALDIPLGTVIVIK